MDPPTPDVVDVASQGAGADLVIDREALRCSVRLERLVVRAGGAEQASGCVGGTGSRRLLRFDLVTSNRGPDAVTLGSPVKGASILFAPPPQAGILGFVRYSLVGGDGSEAAGAVSNPAVPCLADDRRDPGGAATPRFTCGDQGLQAGWSSVHASSQACQWIDVTGVPAGRYRLHVTINRAGFIPEGDRRNNDADLDVDLPGETSPGAVTDTCPPPLVAGCVGDEGPRRDCGWSADPAGARACTPGAIVTVGCNARCAPGPTACEGDPVLRVCEGERACADSGRLVFGDDACGSPCPEVSFRCPDSGRYTVLTGASRPGQRHRCDVTVR